MPEPEPPTDAPTWTIGQGLGFLVALPGAILTVLGVAAMLVAVTAIEDKDEALLGLAAAGGATLLGLVIAVPGLIVFFKCRRP